MGCAVCGIHLGNVTYEYEIKNILSKQQILWIEKMKKSEHLERERTRKCEIALNTLNL